MYLNTCTYMRRVTDGRTTDGIMDWQTDRRTGERTNGPRNALIDGQSPLAGEFVEIAMFIRDPVHQNGIPTVIVRFFLPFFFAILWAGYLKLSSTYKSLTDQLQSVGHSPGPFFLILIKVTWFVRHIGFCLKPLRIFFYITTEPIQLIIIRRTNHK